MGIEDFPIETPFFLKGLVVQKEEDRVNMGLSVFKGPEPF